MNGITALVVGADVLGNIPNVLQEHNISVGQHINGRAPAHQKKSLHLPSGTNLVILLTDFLGHNVMKSFRSAAQKSNVKVLACRRSVSSLKQALAQGGFTVKQ